MRYEFYYKKLLIIIILLETPNPQWVSINNGIFICLKCCGLHKELGLNYSLIKSLSMDELSQNDLDYLRTGGNNKLNNFLEGFNINKQTFSLEEKYKTKASVYYRALVYLHIFVY